MPLILPSLNSELIDIYNKGKKGNPFPAAVGIKTGNNYVLMGDVIDIKDSTGNAHLIIARGNSATNKYVELLHNDNLYMQSVIVISHWFLWGGMI